MSKRTYITNITPLPSSITRDVAIAQLHDHHGMIELNPLVLRHESTDPPPNASDDEAERAIWYEITDRINYLPGGALKSEVSYKACFYNLPTGLQTHVFAPAGVDIRSKWSVGGNEPGEPKEARELGMDNIPHEGLYIKEEVDLRCSIFMSNFVKKNLKKSHLVVADKIVARAALMKRPSVHSSPLAQRHSASRSVEDLVNWTPSMITQQTSFPSDSSIPRQLQPGPGSPLPRCMCERSPHQPNCPFFNPGDGTPQDTFFTRERRRSLPFHAISLPSDSSYSQTTTPTISPQQRTRPSELHGSAGKNSCLCTGGLHAYGCPLYPGLRLMLSAASSPSHTFSSSNTFPFPGSTNAPSRSRATDIQLFMAQRPGEQAELGAIRSPVNNADIQQTLSAPGETTSGNNVVADGTDAVRFPRFNRGLR